MKRILRFLAVGVLSLLVAICFVSCGNEGNGEIELSIKETATPNTNFVLGEDVKLEGGVLIVKDGDNVSEVSMTAEGVTVTGYDKNTLGEQTVTVTYLEKSVTLSVTYVERMIVTDFTADYLQGTEFDLGKGKLKITRDNGTTFTVAFSNTKVSFSGFDPDKIGEQTVTAIYKQNDATYSASFKVTVYEIESIKLVPPSKISYKSHDTGINVIGGQIVLTGKGGELKSTVGVNEDMINGFDLTAANRFNSPYTQTVNVRYNGVDYPYEIKITYSDISDFNDVTAGLSAIDFAEWDTWSSETNLPTVEDSLGEELVRIMRVYVKMDADERKLIDSATAKKAARAAMVWAYGEWYDDMITLSDAFTVVNGYIEITAESENAAKNAIEALKISDRDLYNYSDIISALALRFANDRVFGSVTFNRFPNITAEDYAELSETLEYMVELHALIEKVPATWSEDGVENYSTEIALIFDKIVNGGYYSYSYAQLYRVVSSWRAADDAFDFLFNYYYLKSDLDSLVKLSNVSLPTELEQIFSYIYMAIECSENINSYNGNTTRVFYGYYMAEQLSTLLLLGNDAMQKDLFYIIPLNGMLGLGNSAELTEYTFYNVLEYIRTMAGGYYYYSAGLLGIESYETFMNEYLYVLRRYSTDASYKTSEEFGEDAERLMRVYMELTPSEQASLAVTLNVFHGTEYGAPYMFDTSGEYAKFETQLAQLFRIYYHGLFESEAGKNAYTALMIATEAYTQRYTTPNWKSVYDEKMALVKTLLSSMSTDEQELFNSKLGYIATKYNTLVATSIKHQQTTTTAGLDLKGWEDEFSALHEALLFTELGMLYTNNNIRYYDIFLAAYERAERIANDILKNAPAEVVEIYRHAGLYSSKSYDEFFTEGWVDSDPESTEYMSYEYALSVFRSHYINAINVNILGSSIYDDYFGESGLRAFTEKCYDLFVPFLMQQLFEGASDTKFDSEKIMDAIYAFSKLTTYEKLVFLQYMDVADGNIFIMSVGSFAASNHTDKAATLVQDLINLEIGYIVYDYHISVGTSSDKDIADALEILKTRLDTVKDEFSALDGEDESSFAPFEELYNEITARAEKAISDAATPDDGGAAA